MESFGERLKNLRKEKGLTQKELALKIDNAQSAIYYWESNKQEPTISALKKLCLFFDVTADYLIGLEDMDGHRESETYEFSYKDKYTEYKHKRR